MGLYTLIEAALIKRWADQYHPDRKKVAVAAGVAAAGVAAAAVGVVVAGVVVAAVAGAVAGSVPVRGQQP
jgi:outer membrane lipoprotein SlyB